MKKISGQPHKVYHIHLCGEEFSQTARHKIGFGHRSEVEPRFVCQAHLAPGKFRQNDQSGSEINDCANGA